MKTYTYKIVDERYLEIGGEPYESGEDELVSFIAREVKIRLFDFAIPIIRSQANAKDWEQLHRRLRCRILDGLNVVSVLAVDRDGNLTGDDGGGWEAADEFDAQIEDAAAKTFSSEYLKLLEDVKAGKRAAPQKPSDEAIARARARVGHSTKAETKTKPEVRSANGRKKR